MYVCVCERERDIEKGRVMATNRERQREAGSERVRVRE